MRFFMVYEIFYGVMGCACLSRLGDWGIPWLTCSERPSYLILAKNLVQNSRGDNPKHSPKARGDSQDGYLPLPKKANTAW